MRVVFRVDASLEIGSGHMARCLTLARALRRRGLTCQFISRVGQKYSFDLINRHGFELIALPEIDETCRVSDGHSGSSSLKECAPDLYSQRDAAQVKSALKEARIDLFIVDHYKLAKQWESLIRSFCNNIMVIDDLADRPHDCDLLLDQNLVADYRQRYDGIVPSSCIRILGPEFALLDPSYAELRAKAVFHDDPPSRILVYFGGADQGNLTGMAISAVKTLDRENINLDVVVSRKSPHFKEISSQVQGWVQARVHSDKVTLAPLLKDSDLVVGGGGVSSWERCCLGVQAVVISVAENQISASQELHNLGLIQYLGHKNAVDKKLLVDAIRKLLDTPRSERVFELGRNLVDGKGADRVADKIAQKISVRPYISRNELRAKFSES